MQHLAHIASCQVNFESCVGRRKPHLRRGRRPNPRGRIAGNMLREELVLLRIHRKLATECSDQSSRCAVPPLLDMAVEHALKPAHAAPETSFSLGAWAWAATQHAMASAFSARSLNALATIQRR